MRKTIAIGLVAGAALIGAATQASADSPSNFCPGGYRESDVLHGSLLLAIGPLTDAGYRGPAFLDDPVNGGNGDGFICGRPIENQTRPDGSTLYDWWDNRFPPAQH